MPYLSFLAINYNINMLIYQRDYIITDYLDEHVTILNKEPRLKIVNGGKEALKQFQNICKIVYNGSHEKLVEFKNQISSEILDKYNFVFSGLDFLDNVYTIGDEENDLAMIMSSLNGCCVANANPKLKEVAKYITLSNEEDGVAVLIDQKILNKKIIVSACLLGDNCKYNGGNNLKQNIIDDLKDYTIIKICPEVFGGLLIPRIPAEIKGEKVINKEGIDVTTNYMKGAKIALELALKHNAKIAILKQKSPSCGVGKIYDGTFNGIIVDGFGMTSRLFKEYNIELYTEDNYQEILKKKS